MAIKSTSSNGHISVLLALCEGNPPVTFALQRPVDPPHKRPVIRSFDVLFDLRLNKRLSKQSRRRWFEKPSCEWKSELSSCDFEASPEVIHYSDVTVMTHVFNNFSSNAIDLNEQMMISIIDGVLKNLAKLRGLSNKIYVGTFPRYRFCHHTTLVNRWYMMEVTLSDNQASHTTDACK